MCLNYKSINCKKNEAFNRNMKIQYIFPSFTKLTPENEILKKNNFEATMQIINIIRIKF